MSGRRLVAIVAVSALSIGIAAGSGTGLAAGLPFVSQAVTAYRTCTLTAATTTTAAVADASVRQSSATTNYGTATTNTVTTQSGANRRLYVRFDLTQCSPTIPAAAIVRLATLRIYASALPSGVCRTVDIFRVTAAWTESTITWNSQPFGTAINSPAAGSASDTFTIGTLAGCGNTAPGYLLGATLTTDVAGFVAGTYVNNGWMLRDAVEGSATAYTSTYSAKELGTIAQAPQLIVTYQLVA